MRRRLSIFWLMFVLNLQPKFVKSVSDGDKVKVFSDHLGAYKFNHLATNKLYGKVYVGAMNRLYQLSVDLELLDNVTTCSPFDPKNYNKILVVDNLNNQLIFCGTSTKCPCSAYDFKGNSAKLNFKQNAAQKIALGSANASTVAFISNMYDSPRYQKLFVAVSNNGCFFNSSAMAVRKLFDVSFLRADETSATHLNTFNADYQHHCRVNYVYGFASERYNYFLTTQLNYSAQKSAYVSKLIRVCDRGQNSLLSGYSEIPIECKFHNISAYNLVQAATVGKPNPQLAKSLNIERDDDVLFAIFSKSKYAEATLNEPSDHSALCIYSLKEINKMFHENIKNCLKGKGNRGFGSLLLNPQCKKEIENVDIENFNFCTSEVNMPLDGNQPITKSPVIKFNTRMTAIASKRNENHNDVFVGTNMGHLKFVKVINSTSACELIDVPIDEGSPVNSDLLLSPNNESLFVMTEHKLTKIKIPIKLENCSDNENFDSCIQSTYNYCGWCRSSNKCTTKCECSNNNHLVWYSHDFRNDIKIADRNSDKSLLNPGETLILNITNLPSINDTLYCVFFFKYEIFQTAATLLSNSVGFKVLSCSTPDENETSMISPSTDNFIIKLAIRTTQFGDMATTNVTFSRCFSFTSCETCISKKSECRWHFTKKECLYDPKFTDVKSCESILPKRPPRSSPSIKSFWPLLGPVEGGTNITIQVSSLTDKFEDIDKTIKVAGAKCAPHEDMFEPMKMIGCGIENSTLEPDHEGPVEVQINGTSLISEQKFKFVNPAITSINPNQGPVYGGTPVEIKGENLNAGRAVEAFVGESCVVFLRNSSVIQCITQPSEEKAANVSVKFDGNTRRYLHNDSFKFVKDPLRDENGYNNEPKGILAGGVEILIRNINPPPNCQLFLLIHSERTTYNNTCEIMNDSKTWTCVAPSITDIPSDSLNVEKPRELNVSLECYFDNNRTIKEIILPNKFTLYPNPKFGYFISSSIECGEENFVIIMGQNINKACQKTDINVTVVNHTCEVIAITSTQVICRLPKSFSSNSTHDSEKICDHIMEFNEITVSIGDEFNVTVFKQRNPPPKEPNYSVCIISGVIIFLLVASYFIVCKKFMGHIRAAKILQQQVNKMGMEAIAMKQYMKRVIIKNQIGVNESVSKMLKLPNVEIENTTIPKNITGTSAQSEYILPHDDKWEFPRNNLTLGRCLGQGEFGKVVAGEAKNILNENITTTVAVKMLKDNHSDEDMIDLVSEMEIMKLIGIHDNVLRLLGCCTEDGALFVITEYAKHGNLLEFLRNHLPLDNETLTQKKLINIAVQVARGMEHLASIKCIHRDLAARNILVSDDYIMKIADFGLARDITNKDYYRKKTDGRLPVKWMAPESLSRSIYSTQSDVWSYGILLWEIFTFGDAPYPSLQEVRKLYQDLMSGYRMEKPSDCSEKMYSLMLKCWSFRPRDRPSFSRIVNSLEETALNPNVGI